MLRWLFNPPGPPMPLPAIRIESSALTHIGRVRQQNQDSYCVREGDGLWAVADGMGGHEGGEWASAKLVEALEGIGLPGELDAACEAVEEAMRAANRAIVAEAAARGRQMGTTAVALLAVGEASLLWVATAAPTCCAASG